MYQFLFRTAFTIALLVGVYRGSRVALVVVLALQSAACELFAYLLRKK